jgi:hypothetical protein
MPVRYSLTSGRQNEEGSLTRNQLARTVPRPTRFIHCGSALAGGVKRGTHERMTYSDGSWWTHVGARELIRVRSTSLIGQVASIPSTWTTFSESIHG